MDDKEYNQLMSEIDEFIEAEIFDFNKYDLLDKKVHNVLENDLSFSPHQMCNLKRKHIKISLKYFFENHTSHDTDDSYYYKLVYIKTGQVLYEGQDKDLDSLCKKVLNKRYLLKSNIPEHELELRDKLVSIVDDLSEKNAKVVNEFTIEELIDLSSKSFVIKKSLFFYYFYEKKEDESLEPISMQEIVFDIMENATNTSKSAALKILDENLFVPNWQHYKGTRLNALKVKEAKESRAKELRVKETAEGWAKALEEYWGDLGFR